jgi:hypothetical protein
VGHGYSSDYGDLFHVLRAHNYTVVLERNYAKNPCGFFNKISIAIAWSRYLQKGQHLPNNMKLKGTFEDYAHYYYMTKAGERLTNPTGFNIPTIGYSNYDSYQYYGDDFLCNTTDCVLGLLQRINNSEMDTQLATLRERVKVDVNPTSNAKILMQLLIDAMLDKHPKFLSEGTTPEVTSFKHWVSNATNSST